MGPSAWIFHDGSQIVSFYLSLTEIKRGYQLTE